MVWYATGYGRGDDVVDCPVVAFEFFVAGYAYGFEDGLGVGSSLAPFSGAMPFSHGTHVLSR